MCVLQNVARYRVLARVSIRHNERTLYIRLCIQHKDALLQQLLSTSGWPWLEFVVENVYVWMYVVAKAYVWMYNEFISLLTSNPIWLYQPLGGLDQALHCCRLPRQLTRRRNVDLAQRVPGILPKNRHHATSSAAQCPGQLQLGQ